MHIHETRPASKSLPRNGEGSQIGPRDRLRDLLDDLFGDTALIGLHAQLGDPGSGPGQALDAVRRLSGLMHDRLIGLAELLDRDGAADHLAGRRER